VWLLYDGRFGTTHCLHRKGETNRRDKNNVSSVRFEVFTAVTMKNGVFLDVMSCGSCKNRRCGRTSQRASVVSYS
jgi:hypothetical protein